LYGAGHEVFSVTRLFHDLVTDSLTEFAYDAELAGLSYVLYADERGLAVTLAGYNDKIAVLARHVVQRLKDLVINQERLEVMKEAVGYLIHLLLAILTYSFIR
jgi:insulysin